MALLLPWLMVLATLAGLALPGRQGSSSRTVRLAAGMVAFSVALVALGTLACGGAMSDPGGGGPGGTPQGTYTLTLTGTYTASSMALNHTAQVSLTVQ